MRGCQAPQRKDGPSGLSLLIGLPSRCLRGLFPDDVAAGTDFWKQRWHFAFGSRIEKVHDLHAKEPGYRLETLPFGENLSPLDLGRCVSGCADGIPELLECVAGQLPEFSNSGAESLAQVPFVCIAHRSSLDEQRLILKKVKHIEKVCDTS